MKTPNPLLTTLVAGLLLGTASDAAASDVTTDFESGAQGWSGPVGVNPTGGVGGSAGLQSVVTSFGIDFRTDSNLNYLGDYGQYDEVTLSLDLLVHQIDFFGGPVSRPFLLELRDVDSAVGGYPWSSVWFKFDDISAAANGSWQTYSVTIADPDATSLPDGWGGYGAEDPLTFEPMLPDGVTFADILSGVDEVSFTTYEPGFAFGFTDFNVVVDNITISTSIESGWSDLGNGLAGTNGEPTLVGGGTLAGGTAVTLDLTNALENTTAWFIAGLSKLDAPFKGGVLVPDLNPPGVFVPLPTSASGSVALASVMPAGLPPGFTMYVQYWIADPAGPVGFAASNALEGTTP